MALQKSSDGCVRVQYQWWFTMLKLNSVKSSANAKARTRFSSDDRHGPINPLSTMMNSFYYQPLQWLNPIEMQNQRTSIGKIASIQVRPFNRICRNPLSLCHSSLALPSQTSQMNGSPSSIDLSLCRSFRRKSFGSFVNLFSDRPTKRNRISKSTREREDRMKGHRRSRLWNERNKPKVNVWTSFQATTRLYLHQPLLLLFIEYDIEWYPTWCTDHCHHSDR